MIQRTYGACRNHHNPQRETLRLPGGPNLPFAYQVPYFTRDQGVFPACEGAAHASCFDTADFKASAFDIWCDARRRQGALSTPTIGTFDQFARQSAQKLGVIAAREGEFDNTPENWARSIRRPKLQDQIDATDRRKILGDVHAINPWASDAFEQILAALNAGYRVVCTYPVKIPFHDVKPGQIIGLDEIGAGDGVEGYHANRVIGASEVAVNFGAWYTLPNGEKPVSHEPVMRVNGPRVVMIQNSWGESWGDDGLSQVDATNLGRMFDTINVFRVER